MCYETHLRNLVYLAKLYRMPVVATYWDRRGLTLTPTPTLTLTLTLALTRCADDVAIVRWLTEAHGVCLIPGSGCGLPGHVSRRPPRTITTATNRTEQNRNGGELC